MHIKIDIRIIITILLPIISTITIQSSNNHRYTIATASTGGTYYPVGVGIATIASLMLTKKYGMIFTAITTAGSKENVDLVDKGEVDLAIIQGLFGSMAWQGKDIYTNRAKENLRSISMLWQNVEQFVIYKNLAKTGNIQDMKNIYGRGFSIGKRNSGSKVSAETLLRTLGIDQTKMNLEFLAYSAGVEALKHSKVSAVNIPSGIPLSAVRDAYNSLGAENITILEFSDDDITKIKSSYPVWSRFVIPSGTYPGQDRNISTIAQPNLLVVNKNTSEETVYQLTKTIYENLPFLNIVHKSTKDMSLKTAIDGLPMPLHPGAIRYYKEMGLDIPQRLIGE